MWFKNITLFEFIETFTPSVEELDDYLKAHAFVPCTTVEPQSMGWVAPSGMDNAPLVHSVNGFLMVALKRQEKVVPASIIKEILDEKVEEIELRENRKVRKKEKDSLKEEIYQSLLPRAFSRTHVTYAYIDVEKGWLVVNTPSSSKAELLTVELRKAIGSLKIQLPQLLPISMLMTQWIKDNEYPQDFVIEDNCILQDNHEGGGSIRCQRQNLLSDDIIELINGGREVVQLGLSWRDELSFVVNDELTVKSLKFLEVVQDQANDIVSETAAEKFDADFSIMTGVLREFIDYLATVFVNQPDELGEQAHQHEQDEFMQSEHSENETEETDDIEVSQSTPLEESEVDTL